MKYDSLYSILLRILSGAGSGIGPSPAWKGLTLTAEEDNITITYTPSSVTTAEYSTDNREWKSFDNKTITLAHTGDKIYVRGEISGTQTAWPEDFAYFTVTGLYKASGNCNSMITKNGWEDIDTIPFEGAFIELFAGTPLTTAPTLPATTLANYCYSKMFYECLQLTTAPELPATTLAEYCYDGMFMNCPLLTTAPELPATTLAAYCYRSMFMMSNVSYVKHNIVNWIEDYTGNWLATIGYGNVECPENSTIPYGTPSGIPEGWTKNGEIPIIDVNFYITCIDAEEGLPPMTYTFKGIEGDTFQQFLTDKGTPIGEGSYSVQDTEGQTVIFNTDSTYLWIEMGGFDSTLLQGIELADTIYENGQYILIYEFNWD